MEKSRNSQLYLIISKSRRALAQDYYWTIWKNKVCSFIKRKSKRLNEVLRPILPEPEAHSMWSVLETTWQWLNEPESRGNEAMKPEDWGNPWLDESDQSPMPTATAVPFHCTGAEGLWELPSQGSLYSLEADRGPLHLNCTEGTPELSTVCRHLCFGIPSACQQHHHLPNNHCRRWHPVWWYPPKIFSSKIYTTSGLKKQTVFSGGPGAKTFCAPS